MWKKYKYSQSLSKWISIPYNKVFLSKLMWGLFRMYFEYIENHLHGLGVS